MSIELKNFTFLILIVSGFLFFFINANKLNFNYKNINSLEKINTVQNISKTIEIPNKSKIETKD